MGTHQITLLYEDKRQDKNYTAKRQDRHYYACGKGKRHLVDTIWAQLQGAVSP